MSTQCSYVSLYHILSNQVGCVLAKIKTIRFLVIISMHSIIKHVEFTDSGKISIPDSIQNNGYVLHWAWGQSLL